MRQAKQPAVIDGPPLLALPEWGPHRYFWAAGTLPDGSVTLVRCPCVSSAARVCDELLRLGCGEVTRSGHLMTESAARRSLADRGRWVESVRGTERYADGEGRL